MLSHSDRVREAACQERDEATAVGVPERGRWLLLSERETTATTAWRERVEGWSKRDREAAAISVTLLVTNSREEERVRETQ